MDKIKISEVVSAINGIPERISLSEVITGVSIDSRKINKGDLFFALKGEKYDGHSFVKEAIEKGAICGVVEKNSRNDAIPCIIVKDTKKALGDLAYYYRKKFSIPVIGITGSNGKTTTKELIAKCLSLKYKVTKSDKSYNSLIGVPITIFNLSKETQICVLEIGINKLSEMDRLCYIAQPTVGVILNIAPTHLEAFKTIRGVLKEKIKLLKNVETKIINGDDPLLAEIDGFKFGIKNSNLKVDILDKNKFKVNNIMFKSPFFGKYYIYNILAAISIGIHFGLKIEEMRDVIERTDNLPQREKLIEYKGIKIIDSTYNANPTSMRLAIKELQNHFYGRKIAILGDMLELGKDAYNLHKSIGKICKIDTIIGFGELSKGYIEETTAKEKFHFSQMDELIKFLKNYLRKGDAILIKGSRRMGMERIITEVCK